jgi:hypothetical protein
LEEGVGLLFRGVEERVGRGGGGGGRAWRGGRRRGLFREEGWGKEWRDGGEEGGREGVEGRLIGHDDDDDVDADNHRSTHRGVVKREGGERRSLRRLWGEGARDVALEGRRGEGWTAMRKGVAARVVEAGEETGGKSTKTN